MVDRDHVPERLGDLDKANVDVRHGRSQLLHGYGDESPGGTDPGRVRTSTRAGSSASGTIGVVRGGVKSTKLDGRLRIGCESRRLDRGRVREFAPRSTR